MDNESTDDFTSLSEALPPLGQLELAFWGTSCIIALGAVYLFSFCLQRPKIFGGLVFFQAVWISWAILLPILSSKETSESSTTLDDMSARASIAFQSTQKFVEAAALMTVAWIILVAPFAKDMVSIFLLGWNTMDNKGRFLCVLSIFVIFASLKALSSVRKHKGTIKSVMFQASIAGIAPLLWVFLSALPSWCLNILALFCKETGPVILSVVCFHNLPRVSRHSSTFLHLSKLCLSYWTCWPFIELLDTHVKQRNFYSPEFQIIFIISLVWLFLWDGSSHLRQVLAHAFRLVPWAALADRISHLLKSSAAANPTASKASKRLKKVEEKSENDDSEDASQSVQDSVKDAVLNAALRSSSKSSSSPFMSAIIGMAKFFLSCSWKVKIMLTIVVVVIASKLVMLLGTMLTLFIWIGAAVDTETTVQHRVTSQFERKLAFWVVAIGFEQMTQLPIPFLTTFRPLVLAVSMVWGRYVLILVLSPLRHFLSKPSKENKKRAK